jgi:hypothetical protein
LGRTQWACGTELTAYDPSSAIGFTIAASSALEPDESLSLKIFSVLPYNRCDVWACVQCTRPFLRYTEHGGYYSDERIRELSDISLLLSETMTARGVTQWLNARNRLLGAERPVDLIARGEAARVREAAESFIEGAYV